MPIDDPLLLILHVVEAYHPKLLRRVKLGTILGVVTFTSYLLKLTTMMRFMIRSLIQIRVEGILLSSWEGSSSPTRLGFLSHA